MQFVQDGPDVPDLLLQEHEEGNVVFFCGAGISYTAGLPGFKGLVDKVYASLDTPRNPVEQSAYDNFSYDATLGLLEDRVPGGKKEVREAIAQALKPRLRRKGAKVTHQALLTLAKTRAGKLRLVTTNFDRIFDHLLSKNKPVAPSHSAPFLPIPKKTRWNGLVYLHGLLPRNLEEDELNRLVITSGDFGLAYLTERWAARFVSELFRNYVVCFVGYSIEDPVLRYMMDAIAADKKLGEKSPSAYAFGHYESGNANAKEKEWEAKGVIPILYEVPPGSHDHSKLHATLKQWASIYQLGITGKESLVVNHAITKPAVSTKQDDFVGRMLWALSDPSGLPAKRFADFDPVPSLSWLDTFSDRRYTQDHLPRYGIEPHKQVDKKLSFSLIERPAPYTHSSWMRLSDHGESTADWDPVMTGLARWLLRHLDDPNLLLWLAKQGGRLHPEFKRMIDLRLNQLNEYEREENTAELERISSSSPRAIPGETLLPIWRLFLTDRIRTSEDNMGMFDWIQRLRRDGPTPLLRFELREILAPRVVLERPFSWPSDVPQTADENNEKTQINCDLVLASDHADSALDDPGGSEEWLAALPELLGDFELLLHDALELLRELGVADHRSDNTYWYMPSISPHWQNRRFKDWTLLIELLRDAWIELDKTDSASAGDIATRWFQIQFPTFKRLALFAAANSQSIDADTWTYWLETEGAIWLWSSETKREVCRLLATKGAELDSDSQDKLEQLILAGPPEWTDTKEIIDEDSKKLVAQKVLLALAKLRSSGLTLNEEAEVRFQELTNMNPQWGLRDDQQEEFSHWMSGTGDPDFEDSINVTIAPRKRAELVEWLGNTKEPKSAFEEDNWMEVAKDRFWHSALALADLADEGFWPTGRWSTALQAWSDESVVKRSWEYLAPLLSDIPEEPFGELVQPLAWWLERASSHIQKHEAQFLSISERIIRFPYEDEDEDSEDPVGIAINHPVGITTQALIRFLFRNNPDDNDGVPEELLPVLNQICDVDKHTLRPARVILASALIALFRVDRVWTKSNVVPLLDWEESAAEARSAWEGFLWSPRIHPPLLLAIKPQFLETSNHYQQLGRHAKQYAAFLTYTALNDIEGYELADFQPAFQALPHDGLKQAARALAQALEAAGDQYEEYWDNRIAPFWQHIWPNDIQNVTKSLSIPLARLCINARDRFPEAVETVIEWLQPIDRPNYVVKLLHEAELAKEFPREALQFLDKIIDEQPFAPRELKECLNSISEAQPDLQQNPQYQRLLDYYQIHKM